MALNFPNDPTTGDVWVDPNGTSWSATTQTVDGTVVVFWQPQSALNPSAFRYMGFADLTQPIPDTNIGAGTLYSVQADVAQADIDDSWGGLADTMDVTANQLIICNQDRPTQAPRFMWSPVATPASPFLRNNGVIQPVNQGDDLNMKFPDVAGGDIQLETYTTLP